MQDASKDILSNISYCLGSVLLIPISYKYDLFQTFGHYFIVDNSFLFSVFVFIATVDCRNGFLSQLREARKPIQIQELRQKNTIRGKSLLFFTGLTRNMLYSLWSENYWDITFRFQKGKSYLNVNLVSRQLNRKSSQKANHQLLVIVIRRIVTN